MDFKCWNEELNNFSRCDNQREVCAGKYLTDGVKHEQNKGIVKIRSEISETKAKVTPETIKKACDELARTLIRKNHDYGNSVEEQFWEYGDTSLHLRLEDKLRRLKQLSKHEAKVKEKKAETWIDAAGYSVLAYIIHSDRKEG